MESSASTTTTSRTSWRTGAEEKRRWWQQQQLPLLMLLLLLLLHLLCHCLCRCALLLLRRRRSLPSPPSLPGSLALSKPTTPSTSFPCPAGTRTTAGLTAGGTAPLQLLRRRSPSALARFWRRQPSSTRAASRSRRPRPRPWTRSRGCCSSAAPRPWPGLPGWKVSWRKKEEKSGGFFLVC